VGILDNAIGYGLGGIPGVPLPSPQNLSIIARGKNPEVAIFCGTNPGFGSINLPAGFTAMELGGQLALKTGITRGPLIVPATFTGNGACYSFGVGLFGWDGLVPVYAHTSGFSGPVQSVLGNNIGTPAGTIFVFIAPGSCGFYSPAVFSVSDNQGNIYKLMTPTGGSIGPIADANSGACPTCGACTHEGAQSLLFYAENPVNAPTIVDINLLNGPNSGAMNASIGTLTHLSGFVPFGNFLAVGMG
jgi:hypothetical protein